MFLKYFLLSIFVIVLSFGVLSNDAYADGIHPPCTGDGGLASLQEYSKFGINTITDKLSVFMLDILSIDQAFAHPIICDPPTYNYTQGYYQGYYYDQGYYYAESYYNVQAYYYTQSYYQSYYEGSYADGSYTFDPCEPPDITSQSDTNNTGGGTVSFTWTSVVLPAPQFSVAVENSDGTIGIQQTSSSTSYTGLDGSSDPNWRVRVSGSASGCDTPGSWVIFDPASGVTPTPVGPTPTPTPASYTISGRVWVDSNGNGSQNCTGACDNGAGDELNYQGATITRSAPGPDPTTTTNSSGNYTFSGVPAGNYNITLTVPAGYQVTNGSNPKQRTVGPNATANFGIRELSCVPGGATLSGRVYVDSSGGTCGSSSTPYGAGATVTVRFGASITGSGTTDAAGDYSVLDASACGQKTATLSNISGNYGVKCVRYDGGAWTSSGVSGFTYGPFDFSANHTLDWYLTNLTPWYHIEDGDVRSGNLVDTAPVGQVVSSSPLSVFFSSNFNANFGNGTAPNWVVNNEYSFNDDPKNKQGLFSYTFFMNRTKIKGVTVNNMPGCPVDGSACTASLSNLATGVYRSAGDLTLTSYTHLPGAHVLLLVNGTLTIQSNIKVPAGVSNLLVVAAKNNISVSSAVGNTPPAAPCGTSACTNIEGIYSAEGSITLESLGNTCSDGSTADKQFTLAGTFITNALRPFKVGGTGVFSQLRSLCSLDATYPVFMIQSRYDFVPQLTDFYKLPSVRWREVNP